MKEKSNKMRFYERGLFALADFYGGGGQAFISVIYYIFLLEVVRLDPFFAGGVVLISEIWDAISDPLMGVLSDNTRTKFGRRKPYVFIGGCLLAIAFALIFLPIARNSDGTMYTALKFAYCTITYLFYNTVSTMINVSYSSLSAEISEDGKERDKANVLRLVVSTASAALCTILPGIVLDMYTAGTINVLAFYIIVGILFGILFAIPVILCSIFVKERVKVSEEKRKIVIKEFVEPLKGKPFRQLVGMYLGQALCMDVFSTGVALFATYVTNPAGSKTLFLAIFIVVQLLAFPLISILIKRVSINKIYKFGLPLSVLALVFFAIFGQNLYVAYGLVFLIAIGFAGAQLTSWIMFPHAVDALELVTKKRLSGSCSAIMTFARKSSSALVIFLFSLVLEFTGYNADLDVQTPQAQNGIKYVMAFTCIIFMVFGFIMASRYKLSKEKNAKIKKYLDVERNDKVEELSVEEKQELDELKKSL